MDIQIKVFHCRGCLNNHTLKSTESFIIVKKSKIRLKKQTSKQNTHIDYLILHFHIQGVQKILPDPLSLLYISNFFSSQESVCTDDTYFIGVH